MQFSSWGEWRGFIIQSNRNRNLFQSYVHFYGVIWSLIVSCCFLIPTKLQAPMVSGYVFVLMLKDTPTWSLTPVDVISPWRIGEAWGPLKPSEFLIFLRKQSWLWTWNLFAARWQCPWIKLWRTLPDDFETISKSIWRAFKNMNVPRSLWTAL